MIAWVPLAAADIEPYLKLIGLIVAVSIMAINHLLAGLKKARAQLPPPPEAAAPQGAAGSATPRPDLNAEVKEFLRRAAQQRSGQPRGGEQRGGEQRGGEQRGGEQRGGEQRGGQGGPQSPARMPTPVAPPSGNRNEGPRKQNRKSQQSKPAGSTVPTMDDSLAKRRVTSRLETTALDDRAEQLSSLDKQSEIDAHVQQSLDHQVGQLTSGLTGSATGESTSATAAGLADSRANSAAEIAAMLSNPQSIRTAIILNEILTRPADRW